MAFDSTIYHLASRKGLRNKTTASDFQSYYDILNTDIGEVTSRDQIINPYDYISSSYYRNTARGRALYNEDLARLQEYQKQVYQYPLKVLQHHRF